MINDILEEILNVVQDLDKNIKSESNVAEFVKEAKIQITILHYFLISLQALIILLLVGSFSKK